MAISKRLKYIADLVTIKGVVADIGTDHALIPLYLLKENRADKVIASDKSKECLKKAQAAQEKYNLYGRLEVRLSDGLKEFKRSEADTIIISGMGGILIKNILEDAAEVVKSTKELILSPHRDAQLVRNCLDDLDFIIVSDEIIQDKNKEYCVIKARNRLFS